MVLENVTSQFNGNDKHPVSYFRSESFRGIPARRVAKLSVIGQPADSMQFINDIMTGHFVIPANYVVDHSETSTHRWCSADFLILEFNYFSAKDRIVQQFSRDALGFVIPGAIRGERLSSESCIARAIFRFGSTLTSEHLLRDIHKCASLAYGALFHSNPLKGYFSGSNSQFYCANLNNRIDPVIFRNQITKRLEQMERVKRGNIEMSRDAYL